MERIYQASRKPRSTGSTIAMAKSMRRKHPGSADQLVAAVDYVLRQQGEPMETYFDEEALCVLMR